jgi:hypothetical protein
MYCVPCTALQTANILQKGFQEVKWRSERDLQRVSEIQPCLQFKASEERRLCRISQTPSPPQPIRETNLIFRLLYTEYRVFFRGKAARGVALAQRLSKEYSYTSTPSLDLDSLF